MFSLLLPSSHLKGPHKPYHGKVLLSSFHLKGSDTAGFDPVSNVRTIHLSSWLPLKVKGTRKWEFSLKFTKISKHYFCCLCLKVVLAYQFHFTNFKSLEFDYNNQVRLMFGNFLLKGLASGTGMHIFRSLTFLFLINNLHGSVYILMVTRRKFSTQTIKLFNHLIGLAFYYYAP